MIILIISILVVIAGGVLLMKEYGWTDLTGNTRNNLVFETRNKSYGAFEIRQKYSNRLLIAFVGVLGFISIAAVSPKVFMKSGATASHGPHRPEQGVNVIKEYENKPEEVKEDLPKEKVEMDKPAEKAPDVSTVAEVKPVASDKKVDLDTAAKPKDPVAATFTHTGTDTSGIAKVPGKKIGPPCVDCDETGGGGGGGTTTVLSDVEVQVRAEFPGGLLAYLQKNTKYPHMAVEARIQGKVYVEFIVNEDGTAKVTAIKKSVNDLLDNEARRVINSMKGWKPAMNNGHPVKVRMIQPVNFKLQD